MFSRLFDNVDGVRRYFDELQGYFVRIFSALRTRYIGKIKF